MLKFLFLILLGCNQVAKKEPLHKKIGTEILSPSNIIRRPESVNASKVFNHEEKIPLKFKSKVTISISKNVSLQEAIREAANLLGVLVVIDPRVSDSMDFCVKDCSFIDVIKALCKALNLCYEVQGNAIYISPDVPIVRTYNFQFLNCSRTSTNTMSTATDVFSHSGKTTMDNGSNSSIQVTATNDFWGELESSLKVILGDNVKFAVHRQSGLLSVCATKEQHKRVEEYLASLRKATTTQVLIEAKIVEVLLSDSYRAGINWRYIASKGAYVQGNFGTFSKQDSSSLIAIGAQNENFSAILEALSEFGSTRTLSSPRITVLNNQTAILKVAHNQVYFRLNYDKQYFTNVGRDSVNVSSDIQTIPIGLVMSVHPSIDAQTGKITIFLRPTISRLSESVSDPAVDIAYSANHTASELSTPPVSKIPVVEVREVDSVLSLDSGQVGIFAGLTEARTFENQTKLPIIGDVPAVGELFQGNASGNKVTEIVILIKATILNSEYLDHPDKRLLSNFSDPRPFY